MIEIDSPFAKSVITIRLRGVISNCEFLVLARAIADFGASGNMLIFLDWLDIEHWQFSAPDADGLAAWRKAASRITRLAIVHDHRRNRQAAWLAAFLRGAGVRVRCWRSEHARAAVNWLRTPNGPETAR